jgi:hypothetical protein
MQSNASKGDGVTGTSDLLGLGNFQPALLLKQFGGNVGIETLAGIELDRWDFPKTLHQ